MPRLRRGWFTQEGCGFVIVTSVLLVINDALLVQICYAVAPLGPGWMRDPKFVQTVSLVGSLLLVLAQWWFIDRLTGWLFPRPHDEEVSPQSREERQGKEEGRS